MTLNSRWSRYAYLFISGMANESLLTAYYVHAPHGDKWTCVILSLAQQVVCIGSSWLTLIEEQDTKERLTRWAIVALSYGLASALIID